MSSPSPCCLPSSAAMDTPNGVPPRAQVAAPLVPTARRADFAATRGLIRLSGGAFLMGSDGPQSWPADGEGPVREVTLSPFFIGAGAVTNAQFEEFVGATGYVTEAETFGWSYVFHRHLSARAREFAQGTADGAPWWIGVRGACWNKPEGPGSNLHKRLDHPAVHVSWRDAMAFCAWSGHRLPTEAEWEYAARGGLAGKLYPWGDELSPRDKNGKPGHRCNIWQGKFPDLDTGADGFRGTAPVKTYAPNGFGLYQMSGNAWEWCADWFSRDFHRHGPRQNPAGPPDGTHKVTKGGSFLCHASYCNRYRVAARTSNTPDSTTSHIGFRLALSE